MNTERKHTPAPWHFTSTDHYENPNGYQNVIMYDSNDNFIIESCSCCEGINAENKADIVLIAAAPDMLEALEELLQYAIQTEHFEHNSYNPPAEIHEMMANGDFSKRIYNAIAAIAKAKGEQP